MSGPLLRDRMSFDLVAVGAKRTTPLGQRVQITDIAPPDESSEGVLTLHYLGSGSSGSCSAGWLGLGWFPEVAS